MRTLVIFVIFAALSFAATLVVITNIQQAQATVAVRLHPSCERNPGYAHGEPDDHPCGPERAR